MRAHGWQNGGGLFIAGTATLTNTNVYANQASNVYANQADDVCSLSEPFLQRPTGVDRLLCVLMAGGEFSRQIEPTGVTFHCPIGD